MSLSHVDEMLRHLDEQAKIISDLIALGRKKADVIVKGDMQTLDLLVKGEQKLVWHLGRVEEQRIKMQQQVADSLGVSAVALTMSLLMEHAPAERKEQLEASMRAYTELLQEYQELNELNMQLVQQALAYVDFSLQVMEAKPAQGKVYSAQGSTAKGKKAPPRIDSKF